MREVPLFIPLRTEFFNAFESGSKTVEMRRYGPRWNEHTCAPGRQVVLSHGYGKAKRISGVIIAFERRAAPTDDAAWQRCFGDYEGDAAFIHVRLHRG